MRNADKSKEQLIWELVIGSLIIALVALLVLASLVHIFPQGNH